MTSTPTRKPVVLPPVRSHTRQQLGVASPTHRSPAIVRKYPTVYNDTLTTINYDSYQASTSSPPPAFSQALHQAYRRPPVVDSVQGGASPHIAGWMRVADSIVGSHPFAQPLSARVATQTEIDLISGHVHIPWALDRPKTSRPMPVKLQKPIVDDRVHPDQSASSQNSEGAFLMSTFVREQNASRSNNLAVRNNSTLLGFVRNNTDTAATKAARTTRQENHKTALQCG